MDSLSRSDKAKQARELIDLEAAHGARNYKPLDVVIERAEGAWMWDVEGKRYLDCLAAYSAMNHGHRHPAIQRALIEQSGKVTLTSRAFRNVEMPLFLRDLHDVLGFDLALLMNTGAEAVETALKAARRWGYDVKGIPDGEAEIIVCAGNFHGRTITIVSFSSDAAYRRGFGPPTPGFKIIPYGDAAALRAAITPRTAAFLVEPIQGEAGVVIPPDGYLAEVQRICRENHVLLMLDEIQSGLGRTGKLFAYEHEASRPDVLIVGKALGGGYYPVSAVLASREVLSLFEPGSHGSTFGGNPLACAVARAALRVLVDEKLPERSAELGAYLLDRVRGIRSKAVREIRGRGLFVGIELDGPARPACEALAKEGVLCKETHDHVLRIAPPLVISKDDLDWGIERIKRVIEAL